MHARLDGRLRRNRAAHTVERVGRDIGLARRDGRSVILAFGDAEIGGILPASGTRSRSAATAWDSRLNWRLKKRASIFDRRILCLHDFC